MNIERAEIDRLLARQLEFFQFHWVGAEITAEQAMKESNARRLTYLKLFKAQLKEMGMESREGLIASKEKVLSFGDESLAVLISHVRDSSYRLYRFDGGDDEPCGYIVFKDKKPFRWLTVQVNRPDPSIGNRILPFP